MDNKTILAAVVVVAVIAAAGAGAYLVLSENKEFTVTFDVQGHGTAPEDVKVKSGGKISEPTAPVADGYEFQGWFKDAACATAWVFDTDTVKQNTTLYAKWTLMLTPEMIAQSIIDNYSGDFGGDDQKYEKDASSTSDKVILNGLQTSSGYSFIEIGTSDDPSTKLAELKQAQKNYDSEYSRNSCVILDVDTNGSDYNGFYTNFKMGSKSYTRLYFGISIGDIYISGYGNSTVGSVTASTQPTGEGRTLQEIQDLFDAITLGTGGRLTMDIDPEGSLQNTVAVKYNAREDPATGSFGEYVVKDGKIWTEKTGGKEYGPMVIVYCDSEEEAKALYDAQVFEYADVLDKPSSAYHGYGEITAEEVQGSTSEVFTPTVNGFDGFRGFYSSAKMGESVANRMHFVAYVDNVYISSAHSDKVTIDDTGSKHQYINGAGTYIANEELGALFEIIQEAVKVAGGSY